MRYLLSAGAVLLLGSSALAADLPAFEPAPIVAPVPSFSWTGPYVGLQGGYAWGDSEVNLDLDDDSDFEPQGWLLGAFAGYNFQFANNVVIGAEIDAEWTDIEDDDDDDGVDFDGGIDWQGSLRGRLGYAFDRLLLYATGGLALASTDIETSGLVDDDDDGSTEWGWTVGAGLDYAVTDRVFLRGEYRFTQYSEFDNDDDGAEFQDLNTHAVRVGVGLKF